MRRNKDRIVALAVAAMLGFSLLSGCGGKGAGQEQPASPQEETTEEKQTEETKPEDMPKADVEEDEPEDQLGPAAAYGLEGPVWVVSMIKSTYAWNDSEPESYSETYTYDDHGNRIKAEDESYLEEWTYDDEGYMLTDTYTYEDDEPMVTTYTYERDADGRVISRTDNNGSVITYEYYPSGRLSATYGNYQGTSYDGETGEVLSTFNHIINVYYDEMGYTTRTEFDFGDDGMQLTGYEYEMGDNGKPVTCTMYTTSGDIQQTTTRTFTYDENDNIATVKSVSDNMTEELEITWVKVEEPSVQASLQGNLFAY